MSPPLRRFAGACRWEVEKRSRLGEVIYLHLWCLIQIIVRNIFARLLWIFKIDGESIPLIANYHLIASGVDSNSRAIVTASLTFNIIMA